MFTDTGKPPATVAVIDEAAGAVFVPDAFAEDLSILLASLDFARVWNTRQHWPMTAQELRGAAAAARRLADECEKFAWAADAQVEA